MWTLLAALLADGCAPRSPSAPALPAGSISVSLSSDIRGTNPGVNRDANTDTVLMHVVEGLVGYGEDGRVKPMLAQRVDVSADGTRYTFPLRRNVRFHNGARLTPREVIWTWHRYLDSRTGWVCLPDFDGSNGPRVTSITSTAPDSVTFTLSGPQPLFLARMASIQCGQSAILHPASVDRNGTWISPIGTGPYRLARWVRGEYIDLEAFHGYGRSAGPRDGLVGGKDALAPAIRWMIIRDGASRIAALLKGEIDIMPEASSAELRQIRRYPAVRLETAPGDVNNVLLFGSQPGPLADPRVRRALALSIDRATIVTLATMGTGAANASLVPAGSVYHQAGEASGMVSNLAAARRLLAEAGYKGAPIELVTNRRYSDMFDQALLVQAMARRAGITLNIKVAEWATQLNAYSTGRFEAMSFAYSARPDPTLTYASVIGDRRKNPRKQWGNVDATDLMNRLAKAGDEAEKQALFDSLHALMIEQTPLIVLFNPADGNGVGRNIQGFRAWSVGRARLWGVRRADGAR